MLTAMPADAAKDASLRYETDARSRRHSSLANAAAKAPVIKPGSRRLATWLSRSSRFTLRHPEVPGEYTFRHLLQAIEMPRNFIIDA